MLVVIDENTEFDERQYALINGSHIIPTDDLRIRIVGEHGQLILEDSNDKEHWTGPCLLQTLGDGILQYVGTPFMGIPGRSNFARIKRIVK